MHDNKFPARVLGEILMANRCEYGVEDYPESAGFVGDGNYVTSTTQCENIYFDKTIGDSLSPTEHANEDNNYFEDMLEDLYNRLQKQPSQGHNWCVGYRKDYEDALTNY